MDKRYKPLSAQEQLALRRHFTDELAKNPQWTAQEAIRHGRKALRLTIPDMAELCGVSAQTLQNVELGKASPTLATIDKLLAPFGLRTGVVARAKAPH